MRARHRLQRIAAKRNFFGGSRRDKNQSRDKERFSCRRRHPLPTERKMKTAEGRPDECRQQERSRADERTPQQVSPPTSMRRPAERARRQAFKHPPASPP